MHPQFVFLFYGDTASNSGIASLTLFRGQRQFVLAPSCIRRAPERSAACAARLEARPLLLAAPCRLIVLQPDRQAELQSRSLESACARVRHVREHHLAEFEKLRRDPRVVREALRHNSWVLGLASEELRADKRLVLFAVAQSFAAFEFAHKDLRSSKRFVLCVVRLGSMKLNPRLDF